MAKFIKILMGDNSKSDSLLTWKSRKSRKQKRKTKLAAAAMLLAVSIFTIKGRRCN